MKRDLPYCICFTNLTSRNIEYTHELCSNCDCTYMVTQTYIIRDEPVFVGVHSFFQLSFLLLPIYVVCVLGPIV